MSALDDRLALLQKDVADEDTVIDSAVTLITGIPKLIQDAVTAALAAGAPPATLQAFTDLATTIEAKKNALAAAVAANTAPPPPPPPVAPAV